ncbi:MAG TPA: trigger factor family protein, partial [Microthrixaceae bacterium]|nr:trigger factor family protein [Microthrixaceae bacterium]
MKSSIEPVEGNKVKISVTIEAEEFEPSIDAAWKAIAKEVRIPGFRPGKVPRKVLEARVEPAYARSEAIQKAVPEFYFKAVREHDVDAIAQPELDITGGEESGDVEFDAVVEVRPEIEIAGYQGLSVTIPSPHAVDQDIADQIDR